MKKLLDNQKIQSSIEVRDKIMYTTQQHKPHVIKRDSRGITIVTADGFELWRGLSRQAVLSYAHDFFFDELDKITQTLNELTRE